MSPDTILNFFAKYIQAELGIVYAEHNYFQLRNRLDEISKLLGIDSLEKLHQHAQAGITGNFKQLLLDLATNNETSFFRDMRAFKAIETLFLPNFLESEPPGSELRIWSAASSTGQEALSLAILVKEWASKVGKDFPFSIVGTDISERILQRAQAARYSQLEIQRGLPAPYIAKYFERDDKDGWIAKPEIRKFTQFRRQNLLERFAFPKKFHLVLCRNCLIYQPVQNKIEILKRITETLLPSGMLVLGAGESLLGLSSEYNQQQSDGGVIYRRKEPEKKAA